VPPPCPSQIRWRGKDRVAFLERLVVGDIAGLAPNHGLLSLVTNESGGIIDDTVITNAGGDYVYMVVNGATKFGDMQHFEEQRTVFEGDVHMEYLGDDMQLLAVQGPGAAEVVKNLVPASLDLSRMPFMTGVDTTLDGIEGCRITRYVHTIGLPLVRRPVCMSCPY
jgi:aminomethyltransferase